MDNQNASLCDGLIDYVVGLGSDMERKRFEKHMSACPSCREEAGAWREMWNRLPEGADSIDPPADLKDQVLGSIFGNSANGRAKSDRKFAFNKWVYAGLGAAMIIAAFFAGRLSSELKGPDADRAALERTLSSKVDSVIHLSAMKDTGKFKEKSRAYGVACIVERDKAKQLVVYVFDSPATQSGEAYHVWLKVDGKRESAGTFTVDESGIGIVTLPLGDVPPSIESVGVTLEPNNRTESPLGPKMFGSEEEYANT